MSNNALHIVASLLSYDARVQSYIFMLEKIGWNIDVICYQEEHKPSFEQSGKVRIFKVAPKYQGKSTLKYLLAYVKFYKRAKSLARKLHIVKPYDVLHINNMPNFLIGIVSSLKPKPYTILDMHDIMSINYETKFGNNSLAIKATQLEEKWSCGKADKIVCADRGQAEILQQLYGISNPVVILNLANSAIFQWSDHTWKEGKFRFVYNGTIAHRLGVDRVIQALKNLPEHIVFRLIGDGDDEATVLNAISAHRLENRVEIMPRVPVEQIPELLKDCHAGIIPSRRTEATDKVMLPVKLIEYCALGIPSVVSNLTDLSGYFSDIQVLFFEPESIQSLEKAMLRMATDSKLRNLILENIPMFNETNKWIFSERKYLSLILK